MIQTLKRNQKSLSILYYTNYQRRYENKSIRRNSDLSSIEEARAMANYLNYTPLSKIDNTKFGIFPGSLAGSGLAHKAEIQSKQFSLLDYL